MEARVTALLALCALYDQPCTAELVPALIGLEGHHVELEFKMGGRRASESPPRGICLIGRRQDGVMLRHVAQKDAHDPGELLTFDTFRVVRVLEE